MSNVRRYSTFSGPDFVVGTALRIFGMKISFVTEAPLSNPWVA